MAWISERGMPDDLGCAVDGGLHDEHGLGRAETAEGGERDEIGPAARGVDPGVGYEVRPGGVEERTLEDGRRQIGGGAGVLPQVDFVGDDGAVRLSPSLKSDE